MESEVDAAMTAPVPGPRFVPDKDMAKEALTHFMTAFVFLILGLAALVWNSERLSNGAFGDARVVGGLHFITLGWLSVSIFGALRVFTGVALGQQGFGMAIAVWVRRLWVGGAAVFPVGLIFHLPLLIVSGAILIGLALMLFTIHLVPALWKAKRGELTRGFLTVALISLWGTWILGAKAASLRAGSPFGSIPPGYFQAHLLLAVFGWVGATVVGVGSHLIPMFALSREPSTLPVKMALPLWCMIPVLAALAAFHPNPFATIGWVVAGVGSLLWITQVAIYFKTRIRKERDPGLALAAGATFLLGMGWLTGILTHASIAFVGWIVIGWLMLFTLGIYHRVIPFLVWFSRFARKAGQGRLPKVKELLDERLGMVTAVSVLSGALIWGLGLLVREEVSTYFGSSLIFLGSLFFIGQLRTLFKGGLAS